MLQSGHSDSDSDDYDNEALGRGGATKQQTGSPNGNPLRSADASPTGGARAGGALPSTEDHKKAALANTTADAVFYPYRTR